MTNDITFHFQKTEESSGYLLWQLTMLWQRKIKRGLDKIEITHTQFVLLASLAWLAKSGGVVTQIDIANHSKTDRMMVSKVLRTLQKKGYITRQEHTTDTRAKTITLTEAGKVLLQEALKIVEKIDVDFFSVLETELPNFNADMLKILKENS